MELQQREKNNPKADKSRAMKTGHLYVLRTGRKSCHHNSEALRGDVVSPLSLGKEPCTLADSI